MELWERRPYRLHREQVMDALWPDASLEVAANQLHKAAHYARRATGAPDAVACAIRSSRHFRAVR